MIGACTRLRLRKAPSCPAGHWHRRGGRRGWPRRGPVATGTTATATATVGAQPQRCATASVCDHRGPWVFGSCSTTSKERGRGRERDREPRTAGGRRRGQRPRRLDRADAPSPRRTATAGQREKHRGRLEEGVRSCCVGSRDRERFLESAGEHLESAREQPVGGGSSEGAGRYFLPWREKDVAGILRATWRNKGQANVLCKAGPIQRAVGDVALKWSNEKIWGDVYSLSVRQQT